MTTRIVLPRCAYRRDRHNLNKWIVGCNKKTIFFYKEGDIKYFKYSGNCAYCDKPIIWKN